MDSEQPSNEVVYDKKAILDELRKAFGRCTYFVHRSHRVPLVQRMEFVKTMTYLSQVISSLEKDVHDKELHKERAIQNNLLVLQTLESDGIIEIKDLAKLKALLGEPEEKTLQ